MGQISAFARSILAPDLMFDSPNENYGPRILGETLRERWLIKISFRELFKANHCAEEGCSRVWALQPQYMITSDCKVRAWYSQEILIRWSEWSAVVSLDLLQMHSVTTKHSDMFEFWFESWRNAVNFDSVLLLLPTFTGEFPGVSLLSFWKTMLGRCCSVTYCVVITTSQKKNNSWKCGKWL